MSLAGLPLGSLHVLSENRPLTQPPNAIVSPTETAGSAHERNMETLPYGTTTSVAPPQMMGRSDMANKINEFFRGFSGKVLLFMIMATVLSYFFAG